jgi:hypothetical protein
MDELGHAVVEFSFNFCDKFTSQIHENSFSGDSAAGMALIVDGLWKIIGIISASLTMPVNLGSGSPIHICDLENYVVYTDVSKFHEWINQVVLET